MNKILLVDDDLELTQLLTEILTLEGFDVTVAEDGEEGLLRLAEQAFDLVLLDVMMPRLNGFAMLTRLRKTHDTPVLMLTARGDSQDRVNGLEAGADDYLAKPFDDRELLALVLAGQGWYWADGLFAILIGLFLVWGAVQIGYESVQALLDRQLPEEEQARIMALCCAVEGVHGVHDLRTRQSGPTRFVQLHLELDDQLPLVKAHQIADEAELAVRQAFERMDVIIHMDPISVLTKEQQGTHPEQQ